MRAVFLAAVLTCSAANAAGPYSYPKYITAFAGAGGVPLYSGAYFIHTVDWGLHPFDGAFSTGTSFSVAADFHRVWSLGAAGVFVQLDLTYLFLSGLWAVQPPAHFPFRVQLGSRVGLDVSRSEMDRPELPEPEIYWLVRPALHNYVDVEIPIGSARRFTLVLRAAIDTPANLSTVYRWNFSIGGSWGYE